MPGHPEPPPVRASLEAMQTYSPAEASALSGFTLDTLRYYEREGIMPPVARSAGGRRVYSEGDLWLLGFFRCLRDTGMPIEKLRRYGRLSLDEETLPERIELLVEHAAAVQQDIDALCAQRDRLAEKIAWFEGELARRDAASVPARRGAAELETGGPVQAAEISS